MPFDISGDKIIFDGYPIAQFTDAPWLGLRIECERLLTSLPDFDSMVTDDEHEKAIANAIENAEETTENILKAEHEKELDRAQDEAREAGHEAGFREGRLDALEAAGKAADVLRVDALLKALADAEMALRAPLNGVVEEYTHSAHPHAGTTTSKRRRPVKIGELKEQVRNAIRLLGQARAEYVGG